MAATIVKAGDRTPLNVLGMPLTMLCEASETGGSWSLFEEEVPHGMGPPPHRHDWDEAYYILDGESSLKWMASPSNRVRGISTTCRATPSMGSRARLNHPRAF